MHKKVGNFLKNSSLFFGISNKILIFVVQKERDKQPQSSMKSEL